MRNIIKFRREIMVILLILKIMVQTSCQEAKRFEISGDDRTPPGQPVFVDSEPLLGGARVFFRPPADEDLLYVEASYVNHAGKRLRFAASYFTHYVDVNGFGNEGAHAIELCAVDRAGNRSESVPITVTSLEPVAASVAKSLDVLSSFASMLLKWTNVATEPVFVWVDIVYTQNGAPHEHTIVFNTQQTETRFIEGLNLYAHEPISVKVNVRDKYDNVVHAKDTTIILLTDEIIDKERWRAPEGGTIQGGGITQVSGLRMDVIFDGIVDIDVENYFITSQDNPWNLIINLVDEYELSRIVTHQRWTGFGSTWGQVDFRGNLYRGDNVLTYNVYGWDEVGNRWELFSRVEINEPAVKDATEFTILGKEGDMAFLYPEEPRFSRPTRWLRLEAIEGKWISEITLYGRRAR